jgi:hypothetical protein
VQPLLQPVGATRSGSTRLRPQVVQFGAILSGSTPLRVQLGQPGAILSGSMPLWLQSEPRHPVGATRSGSPLRACFVARGAAMAASMGSPMPRVGDVLAVAAPLKMQMAALAMHNMSLRFMALAPWARSKCRCVAAPGRSVQCT